jgi:hypothetical protein
MDTLVDTLRISHEWAVDRIHFLSKKDIDDAHSIQSEFSEWLNPEIQEHDIISFSYLGDE